MKTKLKILKFLIGSLTIGMVISFSNCGQETTECDNWPDGIIKKYYHFNADTLKIPYHGLDTLKFLRITPSDTDTVIFYGQGKKYYTITETDYDFYGCQHDDIYDAYRICFNDKVNIDSIDFSIFVESEGSHSFKLYYKDKKYYESLYAVDWAAYSGFIPILQINGMTYSRVSTFYPRGNWDTYDLIGDNKIFINKFQGIVRISYDSNTFSLTLIK